MPSPVQSYPNPKAIRQSVLDAVRQLETAPDPQAGDAGVANAFLRLVEALPVAVFVWAGFRVVYANLTARTLVTRETSGDVIGRRATDLVRPQDREALSRLIMGREAIDGQTPPLFHLVHAQGGTMPVSLRLAPINWEGEAAQVAIVSEEPASAETPQPAPPDAPPATVIEFMPAVAEEPAFDRIGSAIGDQAPLPTPPTREAVIIDFAMPGSVVDADAALEGLPEPASLVPPEPAAPQQGFDSVVGQLADPDVAPEDAPDLTHTEEPVAQTTTPSALDEAHRLSEAALAASTNGIVIADAQDPALPIIYVNAAFERITGYAFDDAVGLSLSFLYAGDSDQPGAQILRDAVEARESASATLRNLAKSGAPYWVQLDLSPIMDDRGEATHLVVIVNDVSQRLKAESGHREAEARLQAFADTAREWFWEFDADLRYAYASDRYFEITGDSPADILGKTIYEFQRGVSTADLDALFAVLESAQPFSDHVFLRRGPDGEDVWFSTDGQPVIGTDGGFVGYRGSARDITEERATQRELALLEERGRGPSPLLPVAMFQWQRNADGSVAVPFVSESARQLFGMEPAEITADPLALFRCIHPSDNPSVDAAFRRTADSMESLSEEYRIRDSQGREKWVLTLAQPRRRDDRVVVWDCLSLDITATKSAALGMRDELRRYQSIADGDPQPVCCVDLHGRVTFGNPAFAALTGRADGEIAGEALTGLLAEATATRVVEAAARCFATGEPAEDEIDIQAPKSNSLRRIQLSLVPLRDESGAVVQVRTTWIDVTSRHIAELRRREADRYIGALVNALPVEMAYIDANQRYRMANEPYRAAIGAADGPLSGKHVREVLGDTLYAQLQPYLEKALSGEAARFAWSREVSGDARHFESTFTPHLAEGGDIRGVFAMTEDVTEAKRAAGQIRDQDRRYMGLIANTPGVVYQRVIDWQGNVAFPFVSDTAREVLDIDPDAFAIEPNLMETLIHEDDRALVREAVESSRFEMKPYDIEHRCVTRTGRLVWLRHMARPHIREDDEAVMWDGLLIEITESKEVAQALEENRQRLDGLAASVRDAVLVHDGRGILFANPAAARMCGYPSPDTMTGLSPTVLIHPEDAERMAAREGRALMDRAEQPAAPVRFQGPGGAVVATETALRPVAWNGATAVMAIIRDETERRKAEALMREGEDRIRQIAELSPDAMYVCVANRIVMANPGCRWLFGAEPEEVIGVDPMDLALPSDMEDIANRRELIDSEGQAPWTERLRARPDGKPLHYEIMAVAGIWRGERARLVIARDISDRKDLEQQIAMVMVEARQSEAAAEAALRDAEAAVENARTSEEAKERFLSAMNEELRAPLSGMIGMAGLLIDSDLAEDQREHAEAIRKSGRALMRVLNDILDFAKLSRGQIALETGEFAPRTVADSVVELLAPNAFAKGIDLATFVSPKVPKRMHGDAGRIRQILFNMTSNAIKFTRRGGVTVKMNMDGDNLYVRVADTGTGIDAERRDSLFASFARGQNDGRQTEGAGLGLAICKELVAAMGGEIGVESEPGEGSTFWFRVPLRASESVPGDDDGAALVGRRALLVGGNTVTRRVIAKQFGAMGISAAELSSGEQALEAIAEAARQNAPYHILLVDTLISDMDATEFAQRVRENPRYCDVRLVLAAPTGQSIGGEEALRIGFDTVLRKPIPQDGLARRLADMFDGVLELADKTQAPESAGQGLRILVAGEEGSNVNAVTAALAEAGHQVDMALNGVEAVNAVRGVAYDFVFMNATMPEMDGATATRLIRAFAGNEAAMPKIVGLTSSPSDAETSRLRDAGMETVLAKPVDRAALETVIERLTTPAQKGVELKPEVLQPAAITNEEKRGLKSLLASLDDIVGKSG